MVDLFLMLSSGKSDGQLHQVWLPEAVVGMQGQGPPSLLPSGRREEDEGWTGDFLFGWALSCNVQITLSFNNIFVSFM